MTQDQIQNEDDNKEQLKVDFSRRLSPLGPPFSTTYLVDTIDGMTDRAYAQLLMLEDHLTHAGDCRFNAQILSSMIESVRLQVLDIQNVARAYHKGCS